MKIKEVTKKLDINDFFRKVVNTILLSAPEASEIWLHGSRATGKATKNSDWDFAVVCPDTNLTVNRRVELSVVDSPIQNLHIDDKNIDIQICSEHDADRAGSVLYWAKQEGICIFRDGEFIAISKKLSEHERIPDQTFDIPNSSNAVKIDTIEVVNKEAKTITYDVYKEIKGEEIIFFIVEQGKEIAFTYLQLLPDNYAIVIKSFSSIPQNGIMTALYHFIVRKQHIKLLSGKSMTHSGEMLWKNIISKSKLNVKIFDLETKQSFDISDAGKESTSDGELVKSPWSDNRDSEEQRFVFLAEEKLVYDHTGNSMRALKEAKTKNSFIIFGYPQP